MAFQGEINKVYSLTMATTAMILLDGARLAADRLPALRARAEAVRARRGHPPRLGILAFAGATGRAPHVGGKVRAGAEAGLEVVVRTVPRGAGLPDALSTLDGMVTDERLDGLFVQFPYPDATWARDIERRIPEGLDVDVMSHARVLAFRDDPAALPPVTVSAALALVDAYGVPVAGRSGVMVADASDFAAMFRLAFARRGATMAPLLAPSDPLADPQLRSASLVIVAAGRPALVRADALAPGAVVIDVGYFNPGGRGDVDTRLGAAHLGALAPVPGSIGPMTVSCLVERVILFAETRG